MRANVLTCYLVGALLSITLCGVATVNTLRLQSRMSAPSVEEMTVYVMLPFGMAVCAGVSAVWIGATLKPQSGSTAPAASTASTMSSVAANVITPGSPVYVDGRPVATDLPKVEDVPGARAKEYRRYISSILDELSEAMRDDDKGSEALLTVRERFHLLQFGPSDSDVADPAPVKKPVTITQPD